MKEKIKAALQQGYKNLGLSDEVFERVAEAAQTFIKEESDIATFVEGAKPMLQMYQSAVDKVRGELNEKIKKIEGEKADLEAKLNGKEKKPDEEIESQDEKPDMAKLIEEAVAKAIKPISDELTQFKGEQAAKASVSQAETAFMSNDYVKKYKDEATDAWDRAKEMYDAIIRDEAERLPAILAYTGAVFKRINPRDFSSDDFSYAQKHLRITSFLYGLLRPLDLISPYRLEGSVRLNGMDMFSRWRPLLTDMFISEIQENGGILADLASEEMKGLFDWKRVASEVRVVRPEFLTEKDGRLKAVTIHTKMCRGEMTRFLLKGRVEETGQLNTFEWEGFTYRHELSTPRHPVFVLG